MGTGCGHFWGNRNVFHKARQTHAPRRPPSAPHYGTRLRNSCSSPGQSQNWTFGNRAACRPSRRCGRSAALLRFRHVAYHGVAADDIPVPASRISLTTARRAARAAGDSQQPCYFAPPDRTLCKPKSRSACSGGFPVGSGDTNGGIAARAGAEDSFDFRSAALEGIQPRFKRAFVDPLVREDTSVGSPIHHAVSLAASELVQQLHNMSPIVTGCAEHASRTRVPWAVSMDVELQNQYLKIVDRLIAIERARRK